MNRIRPFTLLGFALSAIATNALAIAQSRPNIIVFYTDDHGHADLSCQDVLQDIRTPNIDELANSGVRCVHGYSTAPQCVPSRAGLLIGQFQSRFGVESNGMPLDGFNQAKTIAERLQGAGYITAQFGKWHLGPGKEIPEHGFKHYFNQNANRPFAANIDVDGNDREQNAQLKNEHYHIDGCSKAAAAIIRRYHDQPLFLYIAYRAPHVPLDAPPKYLNRFPGEMPERRRQALAMLSAVDDGVGLVTKTLEEYQLTSKTLIFVIGDNGAPLKIEKRDAPGGGPGWDGSLNDPLNGEKGMLSEGGMHVPFVVAWPGTIPGGQEYQHPVSALDVAATSAKLAQLNVPDKELDGVNLIPFLTGKKDGPPHESLMWRWISQSAIRQGDWKLLRGDHREYLYNLATDLEEKRNLVSQHPEIANRLRSKLRQWTMQLQPPGLSTKPMSETWNDYFDFYLDGKPVTTRQRAKKGSKASVPAKGWIARNASVEVVGDSLRMVSSKDVSETSAKRAFLVRSGFVVKGPTQAILTIKSGKASKGRIAWRTRQAKDFSNDKAVSFDIPATREFQPISIPIPESEQIIHIRLYVPADDAFLQSMTLGDQKVW